MHSSMKFMLVSVFPDYGCSNSTCNLPCFIEHRFALYYWLKWNEKYDRSISILSIDYHTDTMPERSGHQFSKDKEPILSIWQDMDEGNDTQICAGLSNELLEHAYILHKGDDRTMNNCESISYYNHPDKLFQQIESTEKRTCTWILT